MKKNKGFGLVAILIIIGALILSGGAYYVGKSSKAPAQNPPVNNYQPVTQNDVVNNSVAENKSNCKVGDAPWTKVLSPNGGEIFTEGQKITVKWESCNVNENVSVVLESPGHDFSGPWIGLEIPNTGTAEYTLPSFKSNTHEVTAQPGKFYKIRVATASARVKQGWSDNTFTINSATVASEKCTDVVNELFSKYISRNNDLIDSKINSINLFAEKNNNQGAQYFNASATKDACMFSVNYSVKPTSTAYSVWTAGNGHESTGGWIINKTGYVTIDKNSNGFYVVNMGTGY